MSEIKLYNTLSREKEVFVPIKANEVGLYTCGPTVYNYAHLGNLRTYIFEDILKRVLLYNNYKVKHIMNITDVGHLTGDQDMGEDKLESVYNIFMKCRNCQKETRTPFLSTKKAFETGTWSNVTFNCEYCSKENMMHKIGNENNLFLKKIHGTAWDVADFYTRAFVSDMEKLNILPPDKYTLATKYIPQQIELIKILEKKGFTYLTSDGVYFDTAKFPEYNKLSHLKLEDLQEGARVEKNEEKKNPTDFALWKFSPKGEKRQMEWESPWGTGFPGWHLECSAMSMAELGDQLDIHCGGIDHINVHHTNEIAQSEAATGKKFFNYWLHGAFLNIAGGKKMAKSDDNFLTLENAFDKKNISPLVYRFAALQTSYRKPMEYNEEVMKNAEKGFQHLTNQVRELGSELGEINQELKNKFLACVDDDLNIAQALAVVQETLKSDLDKKDKLATVFDFDKVLGLKLNLVNEEEAPEEVKNLVDLRIKARAEKNWSESDRLRDEIEKLGYAVEDSGEGMRVIKK